MATAPAFLGAALLVGGCDPPPPRDILLGPQAREQFGVVGSNVRDSVLPASTDLVVRFSSPIDRDALLPRTLSLTATDAATGRRRRLGGSAAVVRGDLLLVPADAIAALGGPEAEIRIEGGASPCAIRSEDGEGLPSRWALRFRVGEPGSSDLRGPALLGSRPAEGGDSAPGTGIELRFDEPVLAAGEAVTVRADGVEVPVRVRTAMDRRRVWIDPDRPLPRGATVSVTLHECLTDSVGNPLDPSSRRTVSFRVRDTQVHELEEDFSSDDHSDRGATSCAWGDIAAPGVLVPRRGPIALAVLDLAPTTDLGDRAEIRFQILLRGDEVEAGLASGVRLRFTAATGVSPVRGARIEGGHTVADSLLPSFQDNRDAAAMGVLAETEADLEWEPLAGGGADVEVPFERPLPLVRGEAVLLDVVLAVEPGARLGAAPDVEGRSLVRGCGRERLAPSATLLASGATPVAQSLWYDAGTDGARWLGAVLETDGATESGDVRTEFQAAPADGSGAPDVPVASPWESDLALLPPWRFVRFRLRFRASDEGRWPRIDRVVLPFEPL